MKNFHLLLLFSHVSDTFNACPQILFSHIYCFLPQSLQNDGYRFHCIWEQKREKGAINEFWLSKIQTAVLSNEGTRYLPPSPASSVGSMKFRSPTQHHHLSHDSTDGYCGNLAIQMKKWVSIHTVPMAQQIHKWTKHSVWKNWVENDIN